MINDVVIFFSMTSAPLLVFCLSVLLHLSTSSPLLHRLQPPGSKRLPERFLGKFELEGYDSSTEFHNFLYELGVGWITRQVAYYYF